MWVWQSGKTKFTIENATKTRVVLADSRIHILGSYQNIRIARYAPAMTGSPLSDQHQELVRALPARPPRKLQASADALQNMLSGKIRYFKDDLERTPPCFCATVLYDGLPVGLSIVTGAVKAG